FTADMSPESNSIEELADTDADRVLAALEEGTDPFRVLEATSAVRSINALSTGHTGGATYVRVMEAIETISPLSLDYKPLGFGADNTLHIRNSAGTQLVTDTITHNFPLT